MILFDGPSLACGGFIGTVIGYLLFVIMTREVLTRSMPFEDCSIETCSKACVYWGTCNDLWHGGKPRK